jgi:ribosome assembly protein 1
MGRWIPLADAVLRMVVRWAPNPIEAQQQKMQYLFTVPSLDTNTEGELVTPSHDSHSHSLITEVPESAAHVASTLIKIQQSVSQCAYHRHHESETVVDEEPELCVFIAKMIPVRISELSPIDTAHALAQLSAQGVDIENAAFDQEVFLALGRVFSGSLTAHSPHHSLYLLGYHHDPYAVDTLDPTLHTPTYKHIVNTTHLSTYMCLGPSVQAVDAVPAGNIVAIYGLDQYILKSGTLSSTLSCYPMTAITFQAKPMLQVAIEPTHHQNLKQIEIGLQRLYQYDPVVEVGHDDSGQNTLTCLGELHLELCLKTLKERFAKCEFIVSEPLVSFRESIIHIEQHQHHHQQHQQASHPSGGSNALLARIQSLPPPWRDTNGLQNITTEGRARLVMNNQKLAITLRCFPLPLSVITALDSERTEKLSLLKKYLEKRDAYQEKYHPLPGLNQLQTSSLVSSSSATTGWNSFHVEERFHQYWNEFILSTTRPPTDDDGDIPHWVDPCLHSPAGSSLSTHFGYLNGFDLFTRILSLGPNGCGPNLLLLSPDCRVDVMRDLVALPPSPVEANTSTSTNNEGSLPSPSLPPPPVYEVLASFDRNQSDPTFHQLLARVKSAIITGFQLASNNGPLMAEPLYGVGFAIEQIEISQHSCGFTFTDLPSSLTEGGIGGDVNLDSALDPTFPPPPSALELSLSSVISMGQLISDVKDTIKICLLSSNIRLVEPMYKCHIQCDQSQLGNLYSVLSKRRGDVCDEDIIEGTTFFILTVVLPVVESFGFSQELLKKTSGSATAPQLFFSHWEIMKEDPFWKPTTAAELEDLGEVVHETSLPRQKIDAVRRRKGLVVEEKIVIHAEKQRTLTRMK